MSDASEDKPKTDLPYNQAVHAMQTGVALELEHGCDNSATSKHLRVGINSALVNDAALARLLIRKGVITEAEYVEEVRLEVCREVDRYEQRIQQRLGRGVRLR